MKEEKLKYPNNDLPAFLIEAMNQLILRGLDKEHLFENSHFNQKFIEIKRKIGKREKYDLKNLSASLISKIILNYLDLIPNNLIPTSQFVQLLSSTGKKKKKF